MNIDIVERMKQIEIQEQEIQRRKRELDARIRAPANAEKYKSEIMATAITCLGEYRNPLMLPVIPSIAIATRPSAFLVSA